MDQHLETDTIFTLRATLHQTPTHTQTLDIPTACHLATAINPPSQDHSWRVVITSDLTKSKSSMKLPEEITEFGVLILHTLFSTIKPSQIYKGLYKLLVNYRSAIFWNCHLRNVLLWLCIITSYNTGDFPENSSRMLWLIHVLSTHQTDKSK